jgi:uncharacterized repeat protein (TIGR03843 family)
VTPPATRGGPAGFGEGLPDEAAVLELLRFGTVDVRGRLSDASNATLYARVALDGVSAGCVYKPVAGERPLWDFPRHTLARREVAAYELSAGAGWDVVPPTVLRDGPFGEGSVQWWVDAGGSKDGLDADGDPLPGEPGAGLVDVVPYGRVPDGWLHVLDAEGGDGRPVVLVHADEPVLRRMALFDVVANNTDRKGGHVLRHGGGAVYGVDHGLTFNVDDKLRTVLWGWAGRQLDGEACEVLDRLVSELAGGSLREGLAGLLAADEVERTAYRAERLRRRGRFPRPADGWPAIPWPAF